MKITQMTIPRSNKPVPNQFIITEEGRGALGNFIKRETFQSYKSVIAIRTIWPGQTRIELDENTWNYSATTRKYRNEFLNEGTSTTREKIASGEYKLVNLNK